MSDSLLKKEKKQNLIVFVGIFIFYKILLEIIYVIAVSYWYDYLGFTYSPNTGKCILSYIILIVLLATLDRKLTVGGILVNSFFAVCIVPMLSFYWLSDKKTLFILYEILFFTIMNYIPRIKSLTLVITLGKSFMRYETIIDIIFFIYIFLCLYLGMKRGGIDARAFSFSSIYDLRSSSTNISGIESYLVEWCAKSFFPALFIFFIYIKKYFRAGCCLLCQIFMYLCFGFKAYLLAAIMVTAVYILCRNAYVKKKESNIQTMFIFIVGLIPCIFAQFQGSLGALGFAVNNTYAMRMLFEPARIQNGYFDYFASNSKLYFSEGVIGKIFGLSYPYDTAIGFVITRHLNGVTAVSNSNTGIIADSYSQLGFFGIILIAILAGVIILLIKKLCIQTPAYFVAAFFFYPIIMWNDNPLLTNFLTNGWFVDIIMIVLIEGALRNRVERENPVQDEYVYGKEQIDAT